MPASPNSNAAHQGADPLVLAVYRLGKPPEQTQREADYIEDLLGLTAPAHLLDVPCGGGRLTVEMAARGYRVTGVDSEAGLLDDARTAAAARGLEAQVSVEQRDMRDLPGARRSTGVLLLESFGFFDDGQSRLLRAVAAALKPGGKFVFDSTSRDRCLRTCASVTGYVAMTARARRADIRSRECRHDPELRPGWERAHGDFRREPRLYTYANW